MAVLWFLVCLFVSALFLTSPVSAITEADKGTLVRLPDSAFRVPEPVLHEVKGNDNLHWLAAKFYGDPRQWVRIYEANREKVRNPNVLRIGQQLLIPANQ
jgi:nucleoid-associated protein YgaU